MIELIPNGRAFYIDDLKAIVVADLHLGYEVEMRREGIRVPDLTDRIIFNLRSLIHAKNAEKLIIVGDVKHSIGECREVEKLESIEADIIVAKGNHDGNLESILNGEIHPAGGFTMGDYGFVHGHSWPFPEVMERKYVFMGHLHPEIELEDSVGKMHRYPCHLVGRLTAEGRKRYSGNPKIFVLSAFNPMVGSALADPLGPLMRNKIIGEFEIYLINGTYLGREGELPLSGFHRS